MTLRHASFFSGVGGLDLGFHRAGIATVSLSEIDPYASAVLAERFPEVPNLGDITKLNGEEIPDAEVWSGGFPCQDLSVAGKRRGFEDGTRSSLAFSYLDLVARRRPRWVVLENVPGIFTSNGGRDFGRLIREVVEIGYGIAWRTMDARFFGVAQRRRRVFIVAALDEAFGGFGAERAAEVLFKCEGSCGHRREGDEVGSETSRDSRRGPERGERSETHAEGDGASNGVPGRVDDRESMVGYQVRTDNKNGNFSALEATVANSISAIWGSETSHRSMTLVAPFRKSARVSSPGSPESWVDDGVANTLNSFDVGDIRTTHAVVGTGVEDDESLPVELDGHRYRVCGNGVVPAVAEWIGTRIGRVDVEYFEGGPE
jgi:DNA-cytosine methyltransferase